MNKLIYTGDQDELLKASGQLVTFFENLHGVKSAASSSFSDEFMRQHIPDDSHFGSHLIAMGAGEQWGFNKNGDHFPKAALKKYHQTFVKNGHFFREHKNTDPKYKIGDIKAAAYNPEMDRIELIVWGDKRKAEPEYQRAKSGATSSYSMSCRVPGDFCSICNNFSKKASLYCDHARRHMTRWLPEHKKFAYVRNDDPNFFDISDVKNPADRTAHSIEYLFSPEDQELAKAASTIDESFLFSELQAKQAGVNLPEEVVLGCLDSRKQSWLTKLAQMEEYVELVLKGSGNVVRDAQYYFTKSAAAHAFDNQDLTDSQIEVLRSVEPDITWHRLAKQAAVLPFLSFYRIFSNQTLKQAQENPVYQHAKQLLPTLFRDTLLKQASAELENLFEPASSIKMSACLYDPTMAALNQEIGDAFSIAMSRLRPRMIQNCAKYEDEAEASVKFAGAITDSDKQQAVRYVSAYAMYKLSFVQAVTDLCSDCLIDDPQQVLIAFNN